MSELDHPPPRSLWPEAPALRRDEVRVSLAGRNYVGHLVAPAAAPGRRPLVLVVHNYQGLKFFDVDVAEYLARVGYVGLAVDMYGDRVPADEREFPTDPAAQAGFHSFLGKPLNVEKFPDQLQQILAGEPVWDTGQ